MPSSPSEIPAALQAQKDHSAWEMVPSKSLEVGRPSFDKQPRDSLSEGSSPQTRELAFKDVWGQGQKAGQSQSALIR